MGARRSFWGMIVDEVWLTYRQAAEKLGISPEAVRALARRRGWSRQTPNEVGGVARVLLPANADRRSRPGASDGVAGFDQGVTDGRTTGAIRGDLFGDHPGDRASELAVEVAVLRESLTKMSSLPICVIGWTSPTGASTKPLKSGAWSTCCGKLSPMPLHRSGSQAVRRTRCGRNSTSAVIGASCAACAGQIAKHDRPSSLPWRSS